MPKVTLSSKRYIYYTYVREIIMLAVASRTLMYGNHNVFQALALLVTIHSMAKLVLTTVYAQWRADNNWDPEIDVPDDILRR